MDHPRLSPRLSPLTIGAGKITCKDDTENMELHLNLQEYSNLITQRSRPNKMFSLVHIGSNKKKRNKVTTHAQHMSPPSSPLPKTYCTRSGSLFLYTDSKIMKDNRDQFSNFDSVEEFQVKGHGVTVQSPTRDSPPLWSKLLTPRQPPTPVSPWHTSGSSSLRHKKRYLINGGGQSAREPYSWNYAVNPTKIINTKREDDISTVRGLSEAVLAYRENTPAENDKFLRMVQEHWKTNASAIHRKELPTKRNQARATRTHDWIYSQRSFVESNDKEPEKMEQLERARTTLKMSGRVPTNTPIMVDTKYNKGRLGSKERLQQLARYRGKSPDTHSVRTLKNGSQVS